MSANRLALVPQAGAAILAERQRAHECQPVGTGPASRRSNGGGNGQAFAARPPARESAWPSVQCQPVGTAPTL